VGGSATSKWVAVFVQDISHLHGSETTLDCLAADRAAVECPDLLGVRRRPTMMVEKMDIPPTASARQAGSSAVLGRGALGQPGDCNQARRTSFETREPKRQAISQVSHFTSV
jgi:hypothetical protein